MIAEPLTTMDRCDVWFVAPCETWTAERTRNEFAMRMGPEPDAGSGRARVVVTRLVSTSFALDCCPGRTFRTTLFGVGPARWAFGVVEDRE